MAVHERKLSDDAVSEKSSLMSKHAKNLSPRNQFNSIVVQKRDEVRLRQLKELRAETDRTIHDKCARDQRQRELMFERMLDEIQEDDMHRVAASQLLEQEEARLDKQKKKMHQDWVRDVKGRVQYQLFRTMHPHQELSDDLSLELTGRILHDALKEEGDISDLYRNLRQGDDPIKRDLHQKHTEDTFRRTADSIIFGLTPGQIASAANTAQGFFPEQEPLSLKELDKLWQDRDTSRPALAVDTWGQLKFSATNHGFFSSTRANERGIFHTQKRLGKDRHIPTDADGIICAGTRKTRLGATGDMGTLTGDWNKRGLTSLYRQAHGPSQGAPGQDHYSFETGVHITDQEFPLGKRILKNAH